MTALEFKDFVKDKTKTDYLYISRNMYSVKGIPIYLIYYNSRVPHSKISPSVIDAQHIVKIKEMLGNNLHPVDFSTPILLENYSREIRTNGLVIFIDLAGNYLSKENSL